jgi:hypothetical protein
MKYSFLLLFLAISYSASAQVVKFSIEDSSKHSLHTVTWRLKEKTAYQDGNNIIQIETTGTNMLQFAYTARYNAQKHGLIIHKYDENGNETAVNKLEKGEREFGPVLTVSTEFNNRILLFYFKYINKDSMKLFVSEVDKKDLSLKNTKQIFSYSQRNMGLIGMITDIKREIVVRTSADKSKLLVVFRANKEEVHTCLFGSDMTIIRKKVSEVVTKGNVQISDAVLENSGSNIIVFSDPVYSDRSAEATAVKIILIQKANNTERLIEFNTIDEENKVYDIHFKISKDNSKTYLFGDYAGTIEKAGIWLAEIETEKFKINKPVLISYPEDFKKRVHNLGFGAKKRGEYGIISVDYELVEFENGDIALCGSPVSKDDRRSNDMFNGKSSGYVLFFGGPVIVSFISSNKKQNVFTMIPRNQNYNSGSAGIYIPYHNKLIVFYNDYAKNINGDLLSDDVHQKGGAIFKELSLAYAIILKAGTVESRKLIEEGLSRMNYYNTGECEIISDKKLLIPSVSLERKTEILKVVNITIE